MLIEQSKTNPEDIIDDLSQRNDSNNSQSEEDTTTYQNDFDSYSYHNESDSNYKTDNDFMRSIKIEEQQFPDQNQAYNDNLPEGEKKYFFYRGPDNNLHCGHCNKPLANKKSLVRHITEVHIKKINFRCERCNKGFFRKQNYENHLSSHEKSKCNIDSCNKTFCTVAELVEHKATHVKKEDQEPKVDRNSEQARTCLICWKIFSRRDNLNRHIKKVHKISPEEVPEIQKKIELHEKGEEDENQVENEMENEISDHEDMEDYKNMILPEITLDELDTADFNFQNDTDDEENGLINTLTNSYLETSDNEIMDTLAAESPGVVLEPNVILEPNEEITPDNIDKYREGIRYLTEHTRGRKKSKPIVGTCHVCYSTFTRRDNYLRHLKIKHNLETDPRDPFKYNINDGFQQFAEDSMNLSIVKSEPEDSNCGLESEINIKTEPQVVQEPNETEENYEPDLKRVKTEIEEDEDLSIMQEMQYQFQSAFEETKRTQRAGNKKANNKSEQSGEFFFQLKLISIFYSITFSFLGSLLKLVPIESLKEQSKKPESKPEISCIICNKNFRRKSNLDRHLSEVHLTD